MGNKLQKAKTNKILIALLILLNCFCLSSCRRSLSDDEKCKIAIEISAVCSEQYDNGNCNVGTVIRNEQLKEWCDSDDYLHTLLDNDDVQYFYAMILDKNTVLVSTEGDFQSVKGYIVTDQNYELHQVVSIPDSLNYDGNLIEICSDRLEEKAYRYTAGL